MERELELRRLHDTGKATLGILFLHEPQIQNIIVLAALEPPWKDNKPNESCVPPGRYRLEKFWSPRFQTDTFALVDLPGMSLLGGRSGIIFHPGNFPKDTQGCILVGAKLAMEPPMVENSRWAFSQLMSLIEGAIRLHLEISYV